MTALPTNLLDIASLTTDHLVNLNPGAVVMEVLASPATSPATKPGVGMVISLDEGEFLLPFSAWTSLSANAGDIVALNSVVGIVIPDVILSAEIDLTKTPPYAIASPTGARPPALTVKKGVPLILAVRHPHQASQRQWVAYTLGGAREPYYSSGSSRTPIFDAWVLVLSRAGNRTEIRIG